MSIRYHAIGFSPSRLRGAPAKQGFVLACVCVLLGCLEDRAVAPAPAPPQAQPAFCAREGGDAVRDVFCASSPPSIRSMLDLQRALGFLDVAGFERANGADASTDDGPLRDAQFVVLNSSTSLSGRLVSTINPRLILLGGRAILAFNRGVQQVELIARDQHDGHVNLFLLGFEQACNDAPRGCSAGDLYTPKIESDWLRVRIEDAEALKNTSSDCRQCHQRGVDLPVMLMRELEGPWTHFFVPAGDQPLPSPEPLGHDIARLYLAAKGEEPYGNVFGLATQPSVGGALETLVDVPQPLVFPGGKIFNERWPWSKGGYAASPARSETWYREYEAFKRGEQLALPHFDPLPSDPEKLARLSAAYQAFRDGSLPADELPDLADVYPDDPQTLAELGFMSEPDATPAATLVQACGACHNDVLDQTISRANFTIDLARLDRELLDRAIERLMRSLDTPGHMPPREFRQVAPQALEPLLRYLAQDTRAVDDDTLLRRAAQLGMALPRAPL